MIQFFIKISNSIIGKIIFGALLFGMIFVLGVGGITETNRSPDNALQVGNTKLTMRQLDELFKQETRKMSMMMAGQFISPAQAIEMGLLDSVVRQKTNEMVMQGIKKELGLAASNTAVQKYVERNPAFADATGKFDRNLFMAYLRQLGLSEKGLAQKLQDELATKHLTNAIQNVAYTPDLMLKLAYKYQNEKRDVTALHVETDKIVIDTKPTEDELQTYYEAYSSDKFMTPEYRSYSYVRLTPEMMRDRVQVTDAEIDMVFDERKAQFDTPEKRQVSQMYFQDEESAKAILDGLTAENFETVAAEKLGQKKEDTDFGFVSQNELMTELSEPVFAAEKNQIIGPVESMTGWHVLLVRDIQESKEMPVEKVRAEIKKQLIDTKIFDKRDEVVRRLEEILGEGKTLKDASNELNLKIENIKEIDITGTLKNGKTLEGDIAAQDLLQNLFVLNKGESTPLFENTDSVVVAELTDIIPVGMKTFDSVRSELMALWKSEKQKEKLQDTVDTIVERVQKGNSLQTQGTFSKFKLIQDNALTRASVEKLPLNVIEAVFKQKTGNSEITQTPTDKGVMITIVNAVHHPDSSEDKEGFKQTKDDLKDLIANELVNAVIGSYASDMGVEVNEKAIQQAFSIYQGE